MIQTHIPLECTNVMPFSLFNFNDFCYYNSLKFPQRGHAHTHLLIRSHTHTTALGKLLSRNNNKKKSTRDKIWILAILRVVTPLTLISLRPIHIEHFEWKD